MLHWLQQNYRRALRYLAIGLAAFLLGIAAEHFLQILPKPPSATGFVTELELRRRTVENEVFRTHWSVVLGIGGAIALVFLGYRSWAMHQSAIATQRTAEAALQQSRIAEKGQITERFTRAINQLGVGDNHDPKLEIRLGAIAALDHIARDSEDYFWTVMDVLTAYFRVNASRFEPQAPITQKPATEVPGLRHVSADIRALLELFIKRVPAKDHKARRRLSLTFADLRSTILGAVDLAGMNLGQARLEGAYLSDAHLEGASLLVAYLERADLQHAHLEGGRSWRSTPGRGGPRGCKPQQRHKPHPTPTQLRPW